jgi:hypothetical protein
VVAVDTARPPPASINCGHELQHGAAVDWLFGAFVAETRRIQAAVDSKAAS